VINVLTTGPKVRRFAPSRGRWILRAIKICSTTRFGGEIKPSAPSRKILLYVKEPHGVRKRYLQSQQKFTAICSLVSPAFLTGVSAGYSQTALVDEWGMITTQMETQNRSVTVAMLRTPCAIPPRYSNSNSKLQFLYLLFLLVHYLIINVIMTTVGTFTYLTFKRTLLFVKCLVLISEQRRYCFWFLLRDADVA
jgi:hypothetical protein